LTDENMITIVNGSVSATPHHITSKESGVIALSCTSFMIVGGYDMKTSKDTNLCYKISFSLTETVADLLYPTRRMRLVSHENFIYSIGGVRETIGNGINLEYKNNFFRYKENT
jgi:hypothetical protein